jgi:hypothetical protein
MVYDERQFSVLSISQFHVSSQINLQIRRSCNFDHEITVYDQHISWGTLQMQALAILIVMCTPDILTEKSIVHGCIFLCFGRTGPG